MSLETAALDHTCNVVRREFQDGLKSLSLLFIVHQRGELEKTLFSKRREIVNHPAGAALYPHLKKICPEYDGKTHFAGVGIAETSPRFAPFIKHASALGVFFINPDDFKDGESARIHVYHLAWHAISLFQKHKEQGIKEENQILLPQRDPVHLAHENMLADAFAAIISALQGRKAFIKKLAKTRCLSALQALRGYEAELYPYPLTFDTALDIYEDTLEHVPAKLSTIETAIEIVREIDFTYDSKAIEQWQDYAIAAQEMAWLGYNKSQTLGAAIYTCEDHHTRAMAYLMAEILNLEPAAPSGFNTHNPFTDPEANERFHHKKCLQALEKAFEKNSNMDALIARQNIQLLKGDVAGWCVHALLGQGKEKDKEKFEKALQTIPWGTLQRAGHIIMQARRSSRDIYGALENTDMTAPITKVIKKATQSG